MVDNKYSKYFSRLSDLEKIHAPKELFFEGDFSLITKGVKVSVVGSRDVSPNGLRRTEIISKTLVEKGITVVSGLAKGVDTMAHNSAIKYQGKTIAVLGTPLTKAYPSSNKDLLAKIKEEHLAISQFPEEYPFQRKNFPMRNKTMALISDATIIIEAGEKSGTRHQGWEALRLGRLVLIMQNVAEDESLTWPKKMIEYGAQVLTRENVDYTLNNIPNFTSAIDFAF